MTGAAVPGFARICRAIIHAPGRGLEGHSSMENDPFDIGAIADHSGATNGSIQDADLLTQWHLNVL